MTEGKRLVIGLDAGPRKDWNTASLVREALAGAAEAGAETRLYRLYDLEYKGCCSCFACKRKEHYLEGVCALKDGLSPVLEALRGASGFVTGSPVFIGDVTACLRAFWERYVFSNLNYDRDNPSVMAKGPAGVVIYAMNIRRDMIPEMGYDALFRSHAAFLGRLNGAFVEQIFACDTLQFSDYSKYHAPMFDEALKLKSRAEDFPRDLAAARAAGARLAAA
ncbi:MAG: NAD(P)H-dependent oxidoreductase [Deltaproteobacteria bacterium]|jgi:multimeric flavodoxin WrbA|nr:NAD(P)H-dependent oxidoreductase [Deltaproteobacteria bacterium]